MSSDLVVESLEFEHFALYRERQVLPMERLGLVLVQGLNRVSAAMDANGVGKTSILDAMAYNWFGARLDGKKGDVVACRFTDARAVTATRLRDRQGSWSVTRCARPKGLELEGFPDLPDDADDAEKQRRVEDRLGFGYRTFCKAVVFAAGDVNRFVHSEQAEQMRMLDEIQGVDFREPLKRSKAWRDWLQQQLDGLAARQRDLETQRASLLDQAATLEGARARFEESKRQDLERVERAADSAREEVNEARRAMCELVQARPRIAELRAAWDAYVELARAVREASERESDAADEALRAVNALSAHDQMVAGLLAESRCPTCRVSDFKSAKVKAQVVQAFRAERDQLVAGRAEAEASAQRATKARLLAERRADKARAALPQECEEGWLRRWETSVSEAAEVLVRQRVATADRALEARLDEVDAVVRRAWADTSSAGAVDDALRSVERNGAQVAADLERKARLLKVAEYWVEAYGDRGLRTLLFEAVEPFLSSRTAHHLQYLTAGEGRMVISAKRENKSKPGSRDRLTFRPEWAWGAVDDGSRGQGRRMDLALFAAMQDLAETQAARPFPIKAWDEPGDALDPLGRDIFIEWIGREARSRGTGFLVTHSQEAAASVQADAVWVVELDHAGARVRLDDPVRRPGSRSRLVQVEAGPPPATHPERRPARAGAGRAAKTDKRRP